MKVDHWNDVQAVFTVLLISIKYPNINQSSRECKKKRIISNHLRTIHTIDLIPLLDAKYVDLSEPKIDF